MKINRTGKVDKKCVCGGGGVQDVILRNMWRAGPTEKVALCPVSETLRLKMVLGHQEHWSSLDTIEGVSSQGEGLLP